MCWKFRQNYGCPKWAEVIGPHRELRDVGKIEAADALTELWGTAVPGTWNQRRATIASFFPWCRKNRIPALYLPESAERRPDPADETRALLQARDRAAAHEPRRAAAGEDAAADAVRDRRPSLRDPGPERRSPRPGTAPRPDPLQGRGDRVGPPAPPDCCRA